MKLRLLVLCACCCPFGLIPVKRQIIRTRRVRIVVPFAAGGAYRHRHMHPVAEAHEVWGGSLLKIVVVRPTFGPSRSWKPRPMATPCRTLTLGSVVTANQHIYKSMGFDPKADLMPITTAPADRRWSSSIRAFR